MGDWIVRFGGGLSRRINSANPAAPDAASPAQDLHDIEALYRHWAVPACFRVPSFLDPGVDQTLETAGYRSEAETLTLYAAIEDLAKSSDADVELASAPSPEWLESKANLSELSEEHADIYRRVVRRLAVPACFSALRHDEGIAALAYGALYGRLMCLESVVTDHRHRSRAFGRRTLGALFRWAELQGARGVCLQVQAANKAGFSLYRRLGFKIELYRYHYRIKSNAEGATRN